MTYADTQADADKHVVCGGTSVLSRPLELFTHSIVMPSVATLDDQSETGSIWERSTTCTYDGGVHVEIVVPRSKSMLIF